MLMCIQNLVKFFPLVLKILSRNEMVTELWNMEKRNNRITEGQAKSNIAPLFQSGAIIKVHNSVANLRKMTLYNPNLDLINVNVYTKFG